MEDSKKRLYHSLSQFKLLNLCNKKGFEERVVVLCSDITNKDFGLESSTLKEIQVCVSQVFHCAAVVNHILSYQFLRRTNVLATFELISFCKRNSAKMNYISSISVLESNKKLDEKYDASDLTCKEIECSGGYVATKIVCERLLRSCEGLKYTIFRAGMIAWNRFGIGNSNDWFCRLFSGIFETKCAPLSHLDNQFNLIPVDFLSSVVLRLSLSFYSVGQVFHLLSNAKNLTLGQILDQAEKYRPKGTQLTPKEEETLSYVWKINRVPLREWQSFISSKISSECQCHSSEE